MVFCKFIFTDIAGMLPCLLYLLQCFLSIGSSGCSVITPIWPGGFYLTTEWKYIKINRCLVIVTSIHQGHHHCRVRILINVLSITM